MMDDINYVKQALAEDIQSGDITTSLLLPQPESVNAIIMAKEAGIFFGGPIIQAISYITPDIIISNIVADGTRVHPNDTCLTLQGDIRAILQVERTLLNFLQRLSGIATITRQYVDALNDDSIHVLDTRKTTPLMREFEKQAVLAGGGYNHRFGLYDMILVKENHLHPYIKQKNFQLFNQRLQSFKASNPNILVEVEINSPDLLLDLDTTFIDILMFDNMPLPVLMNCLNAPQLKNPSLQKEVSGNVSLSTIPQYAGLDIDRISVGSLTHSVKALDLSLLIL